MGFPPNLLILFLPTLENTNYFIFYSQRQYYKFNPMNYDIISYYVWQVGRGKFFIIISPFVPLWVNIYGNSLICFLSRSIMDGTTDNSSTPIFTKASVKSKSAASSPQIPTHFPHL